MPNWKKVIVSGSSPVFSNITSSGNISASGYISASSFSGDGSGLTGVSGEVFPFVGDAQITGSLVISGSSAESLSVEGSGSTVFEVIGSVGTLLEIDDDLSGTLFIANDQNGIPSFEVSASGEVYLGRAPQSLYTTIQKGPFTGATTVFSYPTSSFTTIFVEYTAYSENNIQIGNTFVSVIPDLIGSQAIAATGILTAQNNSSGSPLREWLLFKPGLVNVSGIGTVIRYSCFADPNFYEDIYFKAIIKAI